MQPGCEWLRLGSHLKMKILLPYQGIIVGGEASLRRTTPASNKSLILRISLRITETNNSYSDAALFIAALLCE